MNDPMTFDDISTLYRDEMNQFCLSSVREDLYPSMADLCARLDEEYRRNMARKPGSIECEGAANRRKSAKRLCSEIVRIRTTKICNLAFMEALGSKGQERHLADEEEEYFFLIRRLTRDQLNAWKPKLEGRE